MGLFCMRKEADLMMDEFGRKLDYMRVSITDRCNLRCQYCMPEDLPLISHLDILSYEEILRLCAVMAGMGIRNVKVTGGEPLTRKGAVPFILKLKALPGIEHITLTTNAVLLNPHIEALQQMKLDGINISLDTLSPVIYKKITGRDEFHQVWLALNSALNAGLQVKINCVPIKGINEQEILSFVNLAKDLPLNIRFIELMPTGAQGKFMGVSSDEIITLIAGKYLDLEPDPTKHGFGPARYFKSNQLKGSIGIISAISNHFCSTCNRIRLTSEGFLKLCLYHSDGLDLRKMLREGARDAEIETAVKMAVYQKPERHFFGYENSESGIEKMSRIGG